MGRVLRGGSANDKNNIYFDFNVTFNTEQIISRRAALRAEETSIYSWSKFCSVHC